MRSPCWTKEALQPDSFRYLVCRLPSIMSGFACISTLVTRPARRTLSSAGPTPSRRGRTASPWPFDITKPACEPNWRAHNDYETADNVLSRVRHESSAAGWHYTATVSTIELAGVRFLAGDTNAAVETAAPALVTGAQAGLLRTIVDAGPEPLKIVADLRDASRAGRWPAGFPQVSAYYLSRLLATAHADAENAAIPVIARGAERTPMPEEPLNTREIEVLRLLDRGLSNKQIARNLGVSINTVKWYLKSIYVKLSVTRRGESVSEARRRHILP